MSNEKDIVITAYGHDKTIDKIAVNLFDDSSDAKMYCDTIGNMELKNDAWVSVKAISKNVPYSLDTFLLANFDIILQLSDLAVQKVLREVDAQTLTVALQYANEAIKEKIFCNMSKRGALMLKDDIEAMTLQGSRDADSSWRMNYAKQKQCLIVMVIRHLEEVGEIIIDSKGGTTE